MFFCQATSVVDDFKLKFAHPVRLEEKNSLLSTSNTKDHVWANLKITERVSWKDDAQRSIFDELRSAWKCDQTRSSRSKLKVKEGTVKQNRKNPSKSRSDILTASRSWFPLSKLDEFLMSLRNLELPWSLVTGIRQIQYKVFNRNILHDCSA